MNMSEYKKLTGLDIWDAGNQDILRKLVNREVVYCVSMLVYELAQKADEFPDYADDLYDAYLGIPDYEEAIREYLDGLERDELLEVADNQNISVYDDAQVDDVVQDIINDLNLNEMREFCADFDIDTFDYETEIYEHWIISDWFADKLESHGHKVIRDFFGMTIWCRPTTGQAILLDGVIAEIAIEMEILKGMKNEWPTI